MRLLGTFSVRAGADPDSLLPVQRRRPQVRPASPGRVAGRTRTALVHGLPALLTLLLCLIGITTPELWRDEAATWSAASRSPGELWRLLNNVDAVSGFYYVFMHGWIRIFGDSVLALRMPSVLAMSASAVFVTLIGRRLFGQRAGFAAGFVWAVLPAVSRYGQEARSYSFAVLGVAAATWMLLRSLERPSPWRWAGYVGCLAWSGLSHLVALACLAGHVVMVIVLRGGRPWGRVLAEFAVAVVAGTAVTAWVLVKGLEQQSRQIVWPAPDWSDLVEVFPQLFCSGMVAGAVVLASVFAWTSARPRTVSAVAAAAWLPFFGVWILSQFTSVSYFVARYLLFTLPAWALLVGAALAVVPWRATLAAVLVLALLGWPDQRALRGGGAHDMWTYPIAPPGQDEPLRYGEAATVIRDGMRPGDGIVYDRRVPGWMIDIGMAYQLRDDMVLRDVFAQRSAKHMNDLFALECSKPSRCLKGEQRLWVVTFGNTPDPLQALPQAQAQALAEHYALAQVETVTGLTVALLERVQER